MRSAFSKVILIETDDHDNYVIGEDVCKTNET